MLLSSLSHLTTPTKGVPSDAQQPQTGQIDRPSPGAMQPPDTLDDNPVILKQFIGRL